MSSAPLLPVQAAPGTQLGPYTLRARLGVGGMAAVYAAQDADGQTVALKVLHPSGSQGEERARFEREYRALASVVHPNIVRVLAAGSSDGLSWIAMELVDGEDLDVTVRRWKERPDPSRFVAAEKILRGLCEALEHIHARGLIHRDLKPSNVLLTADGTPKLTDFGVVKSLDTASIATHAGRMVGTVAYMAPELIADEPADARTDLYGLGAVLYTLLTLERPIDADNVAGFLARHLTEPPRPPHEIDPDVPPRLERICLRLLEKDRELRFPDARAVLSALDGDAPDEEQQLFGRPEVLRAALDAFDRLAGRQSSVLWLEGADGSGRSTTLRLLVALARRRGHSVAEIGAGRGDEVVWFADDLHTAAPERRIAVETTLASAISRPRLVIVAVDPDALRPPLPARLLGGAHRLRLGPLDARALGGLLRDRGVSALVTPALAQRLGGTPQALPGAALDVVSALFDAGWLVPTPDGSGLVPDRPVSEFRDRDLPPTRAVRASVQRALDQLDDDGREVVELLAVLRRPAGATLIARAVERPARVPETLHALMSAGIVVADDGHDDLTLRLALPGAITTVIERLSPPVLRARHQALSQALRRNRRRGGASAELARHLAAAGLTDEALTLHAESAAAALRSGRAADALEAADAALSLLASGVEVEAPAVARAAALRQRGEALVGLSRFEEAVGALSEAVSAAEALPEAREGVGAALALLGRALHRAGRVAEAEPLLVEAMATVGAAEQPAVARLVADVRLQRGEVAAARETLETLLSAALSTGDRDAEARARRGLAHVLGAEGSLVAASEELERADDLLQADGDPFVRSGVLSRAVELDLMAGRFDFALHRAEVLVDLCHARNMPRRLPEAQTRLAAARWALGLHDGLAELARAALHEAKADPIARAEIGLSATRVLLDLEPSDDLDPRWVTRVAPPGGTLLDLRGQAMALRARLLAPVDPDAAAAVAREALRRAPPPSCLARCALRTDAALALVAAGEPDLAREAVEAMRTNLPSEGADGVVLRLLAIAAQAGDRSAAAAVGGLIEPLAARLSVRLRMSFLDRPDLRAARSGG